MHDHHSIFICYRREDSADVTGRIFDRLRRDLGDAVVFRDIDAVPFGVDFRTHIRTQLASSTVVLVVIGPDWLGVRDRAGSRRIDDPADHVRIEVEFALAREGALIVPLLVTAAEMPTADQLPKALEGLAFRNGLEIRRDPDFHHDMERLTRQLRVQTSSALRGEPTPARKPATQPPDERRTLGVESPTIDRLRIPIHWLYTTSLAAGAIVAGFLYLWWFDDLSESTLVEATLAWVPWTVFGGVGHSTRSSTRRYEAMWAVVGAAISAAALLVFYPHLIWFPEDLVFINLIGIAAVTSLALVRRDGLNRLAALLIMAAVGTWSLGRFRLEILRLAMNEHDPASWP